MTFRRLRCLDALIYALVTTLLGFAEFYGGVGAGMVLVARTVYEAWTGRRQPEPWATALWKRRFDTIAVVLAVAFYVGLIVFAAIPQRLCLVAALVLMCVPPALRRVPSVSQVAYPPTNVGAR